MCCKCGDSYIGACCSLTTRLYLCCVAMQERAQLAYEEMTRGYSKLK
jgi:hypothetical protein